MTNELDELLEYYIDAFKKKHRLDNRDKLRYSAPPSGYFLKVAYKELHRYINELKKGDNDTKQYGKLLSLQLEFKNETQKVHLRESVKYELGSVSGSHTLDEIGKVLNLTKEGVRLIEAGAMRKLKSTHSMEVLRSAFGRKTKRN